VKRSELRNMSASVRQRLKNLAEDTGERFNDLLQHYGLERFLARLAASPYRNQFILKGALLLRVWDISSVRPTRDIDLLGYHDNTPDEIASVVSEICTTFVENDGLEFDLASISTISISEEAAYSGVRAKFSGKLGTARISMQIDFGFGDRVTPAPVDIQYPSILGHTSASLMAYTPETTIAEKLHVMLQRGNLSSRMKDYFDIWALSQSRSFDGIILSDAIRATCQQRGTRIESNPIALQQHSLNDSRHALQWSAFRQRIGKSEVPESFTEVGTLVAQFLCPVLKEVAIGNKLSATWSPSGPWVRV